jgi:pimeloyl-ACP methyl ester carboxylesterase
LSWWLLAVLAGIAGWAAYSAWLLLHPPRRLTPWTPPPGTISHALTASDGSHFTAWLLPAEQPRGCLLLCHGYSADCSQVSGLAVGLRTHGFDVVVIELRGHGARPGPCTLGIRETDDAIAALQWAAATRDPSGSRPVGVIGFSMGGTVACGVAARHPDIRAVAIDSGYAHFYPVLAQSISRRFHLPPVPFVWLTWWATHVALRAVPSRHDPAALAPRLRQPLLAVWGEQDQRVAPASSRLLFERWAGPKERWVERSAIHVGLYMRDPAVYTRRIAEFFDRALAASG